MNAQWWEWLIVGVIYGALIVSLFTGIGGDEWTSR